MKVFGEKWAHEDLETCATPVGEPCLYCEEPIAEGDKGVVMPFTDESGTREVPEHRECFMRSIFGSLGHLTGTCSCYGGKNEDPPDMTVRQAAKAAADFIDNKHG